MSKKGPNFKRIQSISSRAQVDRRYNELCQTFAENLSVNNNHKLYLKVIDTLTQRAEMGEVFCEFDDQTWTSLNGTLYYEKDIVITVKSLLQWEGFKVDTGEKFGDNVIISWG